jgi:hypothetical protein
MKKKSEDNLKAYLLGLPVIERGITDDLVIQTPEIKVWVSRLYRADGAAEDNEITVEHFYAREGKWK